VNYRAITAEQQLAAFGETYLAALETTVRRCRHYELLDGGCVAGFGFFTFGGRFGVLSPMIYLRVCVGTLDQSCVLSRV
jgi:hypothetical protein